jgi:hypothetical protein
MSSSSPVIVFADVDTAPSLVTIAARRFGPSLPRTRVEWLERIGQDVGRIRSPEGAMAR